MDKIEYENEELVKDVIPESPDTKDTSLEEMFAELDGILAAMDDSEVSLEETFLLYEKGMKKIRQCNKKLDLVEKKMLVIAKDGTEEPFE